MNRREVLRRSRMERIKMSLVKAKGEGKSLSYESFIALLMVEEGLSRRTAKEYLDALVVYGFCKKENDLLEWNDYEQQ